MRSSHFATSHLLSAILFFGPLNLFSWHKFHINTFSIVGPTCSYAGLPVTVVVKSYGWLLRNSPHITTHHLVFLVGLHMYIVIFPWQNVWSSPASGTASSDLWHCCRKQWAHVWYSLYWLQHRTAVHEGIVWVQGILTSAGNGTGQSRSLLVLYDGRAHLKF